MPRNVRLGIAAGLCLVAAMVFAALGRWGDVETAEQIASLGLGVVALGSAVLVMYRMLPPDDEPDGD
ncbi:MAG: hypothetical protein HOV66_12845 [Streptomycetaceae bacterium]|nr:hypothetical protein [Streptomycetaceae bacterium]